MAKNAFVAPLVRHPAQRHAIRNERSGSTLANHVLAALDSKSRRTGLLRHESLPDGDAMVIAPTNAIHTFFMRFAIDVVFVTRDGRVVKTCASVKPWRVAMAFGAYAVVELPAGTLARCDTSTGDMLSILPA